MAGNPFLIRQGDNPLELERLPLGAGANTYNEEFVQKLAFENPECLPIADIDRAFEDLVPICMELNTPAGPLDALYVTPTGRLVILEAKLWRNPEARRKVVAQILDYAKELSRWDYEDLQREVSRRLGVKGNVLYQLVKERFKDVEEAQFVDEVQVSLKRGRFLLLILGDGIRKGAGAITDFLESVGSLEFTFGLVELGMYKHPDKGMLVFPQVIARTVELKRVIVQLPDEARIVEVETDQQEFTELTPSQQFYSGFWNELLGELVLDDTSQKIANPGKGENIYFTLPPAGGIAWISAYFSKSSGHVGVYLRLTKSFGDEAFRAFEHIQQEIEDDLGMEVSWETKREKFHSIAHNLPMADLQDDKNRERIKSYFKDTINRFVNTFRHRLERMVDEL